MILQLTERTKAAPLNTKKHIGTSGSTQGNRFPMTILYFRTTSPVFFFTFNVSSRILDVQRTTRRNRLRAFEMCCKNYMYSPLVASK